MTTNTTAPVSSLPVNAWFTLDGRDYRVLAHWSTGTEIKGATSFADKRVIASETLVVRA
jgi:hypothetical protein